MVMNTSWRENKFGEPDYIGADHCTFKGASELLTRLKEFWHARGYEPPLELYHVTWGRGETTSSGKDVWAIRKCKPPKPRVPLAFDLAIGPTPRQQIKLLIETTAEKHSATYEQMIGTQPGGGPAEFRIQQARHACVRIVHEKFPHIKIADLGRIFDYADHSSISRILNAKPGEKIRPARSPEEVEAAKRRRATQVLKQQWWDAIKAGKNRHAGYVKRQLESMAAQ